MKKFLSMTMTLIILMALAFPAFAVDKESDSNSEAEVQEEILESASEFAYLDADKATPELKKKILEARKEIIYNTDWVADGYVGCIRNIKTGKLIKELPEFSEVFPGWDVPIEENNAKIEISEPVLPAVPADNTMEEIKPLSIGTGLDDWIVLLSERVYGNGYTIDEPYEYPIKPGTEEWFAIESHSEKVKMLQIPQETLEKMTTQALAESVANYPYLGDMLAFSTSEKGYETVRDGFNGLQELENRPDGISALSEYYESQQMMRSADMSYVVRSAIEITIEENKMLA
ncbi:hypothetical protein [Clostridium fessum]|uniref:hypothetical protein n=1 Tax=Clostridium fessum TaxID=2126740 RepID=UPI003AF05F1C